MKLVKKEYVKYLEWAFKLAYLLLGLVTFNAFLYDSPVQPLLVKGCLILGALALLGRMIYWKDYVKTPYLVVLVLFCASFGISNFGELEVWCRNSGHEVDDMDRIFILSALYV